MSVTTLRTISILAPLVAVIIGLIRLKRIDSKYYFLLCFIFFALLTEITLTIISKLGVKNNQSLVHPYIIIEFLLLSLFYAQWLKGTLHKKYIWTTIVLFESFCVLNILFFQGIYIFPNLIKTIESLLLLSFSILYFIKIIVEAKIIKLFKEPMIWINLAILVYSAGNFFFNLLYNLILKLNVEFLGVIINLYIFINFCFYLLISIGLYKVTKDEYNKNNILYSTYHEMK